uniref:alpha-glucosidase n=1 Tax=Lygus hesperus TaxID=30085 RepID=A0A0A9WEU2_LYGHE
MLRSVVTVVVVAVVSGVSAADLDWWKIGPVYQIYPASFRDSNGDGWGDLNGITHMADYLQDIGVGAIWLSPIYPSPMRDNGYDASTYTDVNPKFGTLADAEKLIKAYHDRGIKVILDFVPNHTSNESQWFIDSVNSAHGKADWYVWKQPKGYEGDDKSKPIPPNNWRSTFGGSAWKYVEARQQFYYHMFGDYQPDLNYDNPEVLEAMKGAIRFWLEKGIDGFRMDAVPYLKEINYDKNEPPTCSDESDYNCLDHIYTMNLQGTHDVLNAFDEVLREQKFVVNGVRAMWVEAYNNITELMTYYGNVSSPFNFQYISYLNKNSNAAVFQKLTTDYMNALKGRWPNWVVGNHDNSRVGTRMGSDLIDTMTILTQLLPGTSITYYGEELGMTDTLIQPGQRQDWASNPPRDPERTPMQWNSSTNAGFSNSSHLYLPVNPNYFEVNVATESKAPSHLDLYKKVVKLHKEHVGTSQDKFDTATYQDWVFAFQRPGLLVVSNLNNIETTMSIDQLKLPTTPDSLTVELASLNANITEGTSIKSNTNITLTPRSTIVFNTNSAATFGVSTMLIPMVCCLRYLWN